MKKVILDIFQKLSETYPDKSFGLEFWDGEKKIYGPGGEQFRIIIRSESSIKKILSGGSLAFGEEYMEGNIEAAGDIQSMLAMYKTWGSVAGRVSLGTAAKVLWHRFVTGFARQSGKNIRYHYDLGNDFYSLWLDPTMTYSCAYFKNDTDSLEAAQKNKYDHICRKLRLRPGDTLVDIGCGWGGMMFYAARNFGAKCTGYTLSQNQFDYVKKTAEKEGLADSVRVVLGDYRKTSGVYDKFVSIGMFEHVGKRHYGKFFDTVKKMLKPGGTGVLHTIGSEFGTPTDPWVEKYIFPGGFIPALSMIADPMTERSLLFYDIEDLRPHYGKTLDWWLTNFKDNAAAVEKTVTGRLRDQKGTARFMRMWQLYLDASSVSFKTGGNRLYQITFSNGIDTALPLTRDYIYNF
ncbi:MAG: cyclopropane-fatty-acyl-phospholipid synthase family protein [Candidatus Pacebacteria bacterium]|jgi:cyclopropane-fatty-acyl-phospholipid synthase|nr:cyclopropane-fatty-acyl-phospholipid synthase family protein [Candidatus Paceibacterota bacterium]